ncbi:MAG TPA: hypothetical protein DC053_22185 [Lachnoclostridium sp.]|nr:hypothetical protein [Lachnoclostridium sp.]
MKADGSGRKVASQATRQSEQFPKKCFFTNGTYKDLEAFRHSLDSSCYTRIGPGAAILERSFLK